MQINRIRVEEVPKRVTYGLVCDFCGTPYEEEDHDELLDAPITSFSIRPGYGSCYDTDQFNIEICDRCLSKLLAREEISLCRDIE